MSTNKDKAQYYLPIVDVVKIIKEVERLTVGIDKPLDRGWLKEGLIPLIHTTCSTPEIYVKEIVEAVFQIHQDRRTATWEPYEEPG